MKRRFLPDQVKASLRNNSLNRNIYLAMSALIAIALPFLLLPIGIAQRPDFGKQQAAEQSAKSPQQTYRSPGDRHKVQVSDDETARKIESQGATLVADYDTFKIYETDSTTLDSLSSDSQVQLRDEDNLIQLNAGAIDTKGEGQATRGSAQSFAGKRMHLIQFAGPIKDEWYDALLKTGVTVVTYVPSNAYLVYGNARALKGIENFASAFKIVQWEGEYKSEFRLARSITEARANTLKSNKAGALAEAQEERDGVYAIQLVKDPSENAETLELIEQLKLEPIKNQFEILNYVNVVVRISDSAVVDQLSKRGDVVSIQPWVEPVKMDERQNQIMAGNLTGNAPTPGDYLLYLASHGFTFNTPSTFGINVSDSGVDNATTTPNHFALYTLGDPTSAANSRVIYNRLEGTPNAGSTLQGCDGHGNLNAHVVGGYVPTGGIFAAFPHADSSGFRYGLGIAPFVKLGSSVIFDPNTFTNPNLPNLESKAYNDGMRISSNSWGANVGGAYNVSSQTFDALVRDAQPAGSTFPTAGNQEYVVVFAAGNAGPGANSVGAPGTAKNVITVGAAENVQAFGGADGCGTGDTGADSANDIIGFSSRGPMDDGRVKPDIMGPGTHVAGGVAQQSIASPTGSGLGDDLACFTAGGVCGGPGGNNFFPLGQQWYTASSGTSHSTPAVAGFAGLIRQFHINNGLTPPTPAMTKVLMMNTARYMTGVGANDTLPSNNQGMGETNFNSFFDVFTTARIARDQEAGDTFGATGQQRLITGNISDNTKPFRVTLAWTDAPGPTTGNAFVNNLDLEVSIGGNTYRGNVFTGAFSSTGGAADPRNNSESVFIPAGITGAFAVRVRATNIAGDGVPGNADTTDQDYALLIYNGVEVAQPVIEAGATAITAESCSPANSAIDPGETVTVNFGLNNVGTAPTTNLVATLQATGGVTSPSGPQNYGAIAVGGSATRPFTFTAMGSCGGILTATFQLQDGANNLGTVTFTFTLGVQNVTFTENFDGVVAPALPAGWTTAFTNGDGDCTVGGALCALGTNWATVNTSSDTAPNSVFHNDPSCVTNATLDSPSFFIGTTSAQINFRHSFNLEDTFDGTVLEVSSPNINGGAFTDITNAAVGGSFVTGGYTDTISSGFLSPIGGRQAWSGNSGGYITTTANLGPNVLGQTIKVRFRFASDCSVGVAAGGHNVDSIRVTDGFTCCGVVGAPVIQAGNTALINESCPPDNNAIDPGERVTMSLQLRNVGTASTTNLVATLQPSSSVVAPSGPQSYGSLPIGGTAARDFTFTANVPCGDSITLTLQLQDGAMNLGTVTFTVTTGNLVPGSPQTFSNPAPITIPSVGVASPYPSNIVVSGMSSTISKLTVTITNLTHTFPDDIDFLLVSPAGRKMIIMSDAGGLTDATNVTITLDDAAASNIPDSAALTTGTFRPGNYLTVQDAFAAPAPVGPYLTPQTGGTATLTSAFTGMAGGNPNGTWSLYVVDDASGDLGSISGGWSLTLTGNVPVCNSNCGGVRISVTSTLTRTSGSNVRANYTLTNNGTLPADNTMLTTAKLGSTNGTPLPQSLGSIAPGASANGVVDFNNMTPGAASTLSLGGTYTGGTFSSTRRVTIP